MSAVPRMWMAVAAVACLLCCLTPVASQLVTPSPPEGAASQPTVDSSSDPFPTFDFSSSLSAVLSTYSIPGGAVALISLPTSATQSTLASSLMSPAPLCPFFVNGLSAAGVRRSNSVAPVNVSDAFHHGSNTKAMTALLINQQVERGRLLWNQTLASVFPYLPWSDGTARSSITSSAGYFAGSLYANSTTIHASWHKVSIQQLLLHSSGVYTAAAQYNNLYSQMYSLEASMDPIALRRINSTNTATYPVPSRQYFLQQMLTLPVTYPPPNVDSPSSQGYYYSNFNYMLLGCVLEELQGRAWEHSIADLFSQLGMLSAGFGPPEIDVYNSANAPQQPWPHHTANGAWQPIGLNSPYNAIDNPEALGPAGTVHASLLDWARLTACHLLEGRGESSATSEPAPLLLHPATWSKVHNPFVWPATGTVTTDYLLSGYFGLTAFPEGWGDTQLTHDGSNNDWFSRSAVYLHGEQPFAVLAAFNAAPNDAGNAMAALFQAVTGRYTRWLDAQLQSTSTLPCNTSSVISTNTSNSPISVAQGTYEAEWSVDTVYFTPITLAETSQVSTMSIYPAPDNTASGTYTAVLALYSQDGVLLGQSGAISFTSTQYSGQQLLPLEAAFSSTLYLLNGTYYASMWYTHTSAADLLLYAYPTPSIYWVDPSSSFSSVSGNLSSVDVADQLYIAGEWSYASLVQLTTYSADCGTVGVPPSAPPMSSSTAGNTSPDSSSSAASTATTASSSSSSSASVIPTSSASTSLSSSSSSVGTLTTATPSSSSVSAIVTASTSSSSSVTAAVTAPSSSSASATTIVPTSSSSGSSATVTSSTATTASAPDRSSTTTSTATVVASSSGTSTPVGPTISSSTSSSISSSAASTSLSTATPSSSSVTALNSASSSSSSSVPVAFTAPSSSGGTQGHASSAPARYANGAWSIVGSVITLTVVTLTAMACL